MATNKLMLALIGAGALLLTSNKASAKSTSGKPKDDKPNGGNGGDPSPKPDIDKDPPIKNPDPEDNDPPPEQEPEDPIESLPDPEEDPDPIPEENLPKSDDVEGQVQLIPNMDEYYSKWIRSGKEAPANPDKNKIWISQSCSSWGIGKNWDPVLPAKYVVENPSDPEILMSPENYVDLFNDDQTPPVKHYKFNLLGEYQPYQWTRNLLTLYSLYNDCKNVIPSRKNYATFKEYHEALQDFVKTPFGKMFKELSFMIEDRMFDYWSNKYPQAGINERLKGWALWAVRKYPKYSATEQTDQAYKQAFADDPNAPKKINPKIPSHKPYKEAWTYINIAVKQYRIWISQYGDGILS